MAENMGAFKIVGGWWGHQPRQPAVVAPHRPQHFKASDNFKSTHGFRFWALGSGFIGKGLGCRLKLNGECFRSGNLGKSKHFKKIPPAIKQVPETLLPYFPICRCPTPFLKPKSLTLLSI